MNCSQRGSIKYCNFGFVKFPEKNVSAVNMVIYTGKNLQRSWDLGVVFAQLMQFLCPRPERSAGASSNRIVRLSIRPFVHLSVRLSVHNSVPLTNKVQYYKFGWWYSYQTWTVSSSTGSSHFTDITCPWGGVGWGQIVWLREFCHILTLLPPGASTFHKHMSSCINVNMRIVFLGTFHIQYSILKAWKLPLRKSFYVYNKYFLGVTLLCNQCLLGG